MQSKKIEVSEAPVLEKRVDPDETKMKKIYRISKKIPDQVKQASPYSNNFYMYGNPKTQYALEKKASSKKRQKLVASEPQFINLQNIYIPEQNSKIVKN